MTRSTKMQITGGVLGVLLGIAWIQLCSPTLDRAQAALEADPRIERNRGYNWPVFKQANSLAKMKCRDTADGSLRVCAIRMPTLDPMTGQSGNGLDVVDAFACSVSSCEWLER